MGFFSHLVSMGLGAYAGAYFAQNYETSASTMNGWAPPLEWQLYPKPVYGENPRIQYLEREVEDLKRKRAENDGKEEAARVNSGKWAKGGGEYHGGGGKKGGFRRFNDRGGYKGGGGNRAFRGSGREGRGNRGGSGWKEDQRGYREDQRGGKFGNYSGGGSVDYQYEHRSTSASDASSSARPGNFQNVVERGEIGVPEQPVAVVPPGSLPTSHVPSESPWSDDLKQLENTLKDFIDAKFVSFSTAMGKHNATIDTSLAAAVEQVADFSKDILNIEELANNDRLAQKGFDRSLNKALEDVKNLKNIVSGLEKKIESVIRKEPHRPVRDADQEDEDEEDEDEEDEGEEEEDEEDEDEDEEDEDEEDEDEEDEGEEDEGEEDEGEEDEGEEEEEGGNGEVDEL